MLSLLENKNTRNEHNNFMVVNYHNVYIALPPSLALSFPVRELELGGNVPKLNETDVSREVGN